MGREEAQMPAKVYLDFKEFNGDLRAMPAYLPHVQSLQGKPFAGVKVVNSHSKNPEKGLPAVAAVLVLNNPETGMPLAVLSAGVLTDCRTGAAGGVAAKYLARPESSVVGLVGCGRQAVTQLKALQALFTLKEVRVSGRRLEEAKKFCEKQSKETSVVFASCDVQKACEADIVVTTTPSREPVVKAEWIKPGTHINAIGADAPGKQELELALLNRSRIVVDVLEQARHSGEVNAGFSSGELNQENIEGSLGDIVASKKQGRHFQEDITVFDSTGLAVQDLVVGAWVYQQAIEKKMGIQLER